MNKDYFQERDFLTSLRSMIEGETNQPGASNSRPPRNSEITPKEIPDSSIDPLSADPIVSDYVYYAGDGEELRKVDGSYILTSPDSLPDADYVAIVNLALDHDNRTKYIGFSFHESRVMAFGPQDVSWMDATLAKNHCKRINDKLENRGLDHLLWATTQHNLSQNIYASVNGVFVPPQYAKPIVVQPLSEEVTKPGNREKVAEFYSKILLI